MGKVDTALAEKESKKRLRKAKEEQRKVKQSGNFEKTALSGSSSDSDNSEDDNFLLDKKTVSKWKIKDQKQKKRETIMTEELSSALDRTNTTNREAAYVVAATAKACGKNIDDLSLSYSTIKRARKKFRKEGADNIKKNYTFKAPISLHWDGKLLPSIASASENVDRVAVVATTSEGDEKLLGVPPKLRGTGINQCDACVSLATEWGILKQIKGLTFDATASNTGLTNGACVLIEEAIGHFLIWIPCRHHIPVIVLAKVFSLCFGPSSGPDIQLFKRFKNQWKNINKENYNVELYTGSRTELKTLCDFYSNALESKFQRDDYKELLQLCLIFVTGKLPNKFAFKQPGAYHTASWMAKAIYVLKIYLFRNEFKLSKKEEKGSEDMCLFVITLYAKYWHECSLAIKAPKNDFDFINSLAKYENKSLGEVASSAFKNHLWYISETLIGLSFFDNDVSAEEKKEMVKNLSRPSKGDIRRVHPKNFNLESSFTSYVTEKSTDIFELLSFEGKKFSNDFLKLEPERWNENDSYICLKERAKNLKVTNDSAERAIALIKQYNGTLTKDENEKQELLQIVEKHRKENPNASKKFLK